MASENLKLLAAASVSVVAGCATAELLRKFIFAYPQIRAKRMGEKGDAALQANKWDEAIKFYTQVIQLKLGRSYKVWYYKRRAEAYVGMERFDNALEDCNVVIRLDSKDGKAFTLRGVILEKLGRQNEAYEDYRQALRLSGKHLAEYRLQIMDGQQRRISSKAECQICQRGSVTVNDNGIHFYGPVTITNCCHRSI